MKEAIFGNTHNHNHLPRSALTFPMRSARQPRLLASSPPVAHSLPFRRCSAHVKLMNRLSGSLRGCASVSLLTNEANQAMRLSAAWQHERRRAHLGQVTSALRNDVTTQSGRKRRLPELECVIDGKVHCAALHALHGFPQGLHLCGAVRCFELNPAIRLHGWLAKVKPLTPDTRTHNCRTWIYSWFLTFDGTVLNSWPSPGSLNSDLSPQPRGHEPDP